MKKIVEENRLRKLENELKDLKRKFLISFKNEDKNNGYFIKAFSKIIVVFPNFCFQYRYLNLS